MDSNETEEAIRNLFHACDSDKVESLLVQCADLGDQHQDVSEWTAA